MSFSITPKLKLLTAIVGPSVGCGMFLMLAITTLDKIHVSVELLLISLGADLLLAAGALYIAVVACKKVAKLVP